MFRNSVFIDHFCFAVDQWFQVFHHLFCHIVSCFIDIICRYFFLLVRHLADRNRSVAHLVRMAADSFYRSHQPAFSLQGTAAGGHAKHL